MSDFIIYEDEYKLCPRIYRGETLSFSGGGSSGGESNVLWRPQIASDGTISWTKSSSTTPPPPMNIKGQSAYEVWKTIAGNENKTLQEFLNSLKGTIYYATLNSTLLGNIRDITPNVPVASINLIYGIIDIGMTIYDNNGNIGVITNLNTNSQTVDITKVSEAGTGTGGGNIGNAIYNYEIIEGDFESFNGTVDNHDYKMRKISGDSPWLTLDGHIKINKKGLYIVEVSSNQYYSIPSDHNEVKPSIWLEKLSDKQWLSYNSPAEYDNQIAPLLYIGELDTNEEYFIGCSNGTILLNSNIKWKITLISGFGPFWEED